MAVYNFSALTNDQAISFNPSVDVLNFDTTSISAADLGVFTDGSGTHITAGGKAIVLQNTTG